MNSELKQNFHVEKHGKITCILGDCEEVMKHFGDKEFDLLDGDPPYFDGPNKLGYYGCRISPSGVKRGEYKKIGCWDLPSKEYFNQAFRVSKNQIIWGCNYYKYPFGSGRIIWDKVNGKSSFSDAEIAYCSFHDSVRLFRFMWNGMIQGKSISEGHLQRGDKSKNQRRIHPTEKPFELYKWEMTRYAKPGDKILSTHGGSFSHAIACHDLGFELTIIEKDEQYFTESVNRLRMHQRQLNLFPV